MSKQNSAISVQRDAAWNRSDEKSFVDESFLGKIAATETVANDLDNLQQQFTASPATLPT